MRALDHPAPRWMALRQRCRFLPASARMPAILTLGDTLVNLSIVIALVQTQVLRASRCRRRSLDNDVVENLEGHLHVVTLSTADLHGQRRSFAIDQHMAL